MGQHVPPHGSSATGLRAPDPLAGEAPLDERAVEDAVGRAEAGELLPEHVTDEPAVVDPLARRSTKGLGQHSAQGLMWTIAGNWGGQVLRVAAIPVMARLLDPADFGLVASVTAITGFVNTVGSLGLSEAVVQRKNVTQAQASALFWLNVATGAVLTLIVAALAPFLAFFFHDPRILGITLVLSLTYVINGFIVQQEAMMLRSLNFKAVATRSFLGTAVGLVVQVVLAVLGAGYWSLVANSIVTSVTMVIFLWSVVRWKPSRPARAAGVRELVKFGGGVSTFRVLNYAGANMDNILVGHFLGATQLGLYSRGFNLLMSPLGAVAGPITNVVRPSMAALWAEPARYRRYYLSAVTALCYMLVPGVVIASVLSTPVIEVVLGRPYLASAVVFRWLSVAAVIQVIAQTNAWLYFSSGRSWQLARWAMISRPILIASFVVGLPFGIRGVAIGYAASQVVLLPLGIWRASRGTPIGLHDVLRVALRPGVLALVSGTVAWASRLLVVGSGAATQLGVRGGLAGLVVVAGMFGWPAVRREVIGLLRAVRRARRR